MLDMLSLQIEKQKINVDKLVTKGMQTDLTPKDLVNMCGIPNEQQPKTIMDFSQSPHIKLNEGKIFIKDVPELVKQTSFYRKQSQG